MSTVAVVVPLKAFGAAKSRLAPALDPASRAALAKMMAEQVMTAAGPLPVYVATDDERVAAWAIAGAARVVWSEGLDLNASVATALEVARADDVARVVIAHGDLPFAASLAELADFPGVTIVPDRRDDGTNVICVPIDAGFTPMYGPGSFTRHIAQVRAAGFAVRIARRPDLQWDVDLPDDLPDALLLPAGVLT